MGFAVDGAERDSSPVLSSRPDSGLASSSNGPSYHPAISGDGRYVTFMSLADNLVAGDHNRQYDIFVRDETAQRTLLVSRPSGRRRISNGRSSWPAIAAAGRFVAFQSRATNLVRGDRNRHADVFVRDLQTRETRVASLGLNGRTGNGDSLDPAISRDGRFVAFQSFATNLITGDRNGRADVFERDMLRGTTRLVSRPSGTGKTSSEGDADNPSLSPDGRFVAFESTAGDLATGDRNGVSDVFLRDMHSGRTRLVSRARSEPAAGNGASYMVSVSAGGRYLAFASRASNLVAHDGNGAEDVFVRDTRTGRTQLASRHAEGDRAARTIYPAISADGRFVAFHSDASDIVRGDNNGVGDVFVRDRVADVTRLVSRSSSGESGNNYSGGPSISGDGHFVAFASIASNLVAEFAGHHANVYRAPAQ